MSVEFAYTWSPADMALRARLASLAQAATRLGADISTPARAQRRQRYEREARANFAAAYDEKRLREPTFRLTAAEQEREIERMRVALVRLHMTEIAHRPRSPRGGKTPKAGKTSAPRLAVTGRTGNQQLRDPGFDTDQSNQRTTPPA